MRMLSFSLSELPGVEYVGLNLVVAKGAWKLMGWCDICSCYFKILNIFDALITQELNHTKWKVGHVAQ